MRRDDTQGMTHMTHANHSPLWRAALLVAATCLLPTTAGAQGSALPLQQTACTFSGMVHELRGAMKTGSPAYRKYVLEQLKMAAKAMPAEELLAMVSQEREPDVLEALGKALVSKAGFVEDASLVQPLLQRAQGDADPNLRAAALKGLRATGSVDMMARNGNVVTYEQLIRDSSPVVREAVVGNLVDESAKVYFGHDKAVSETAVSTALASPDPEVAAKLLREVSMEQVGSETVGKLKGQLRAENPTLRAASATALGGVPGAESAGATGSLVELYRNEKDPAVRKAALEGLVRLGMSGARPTLQSLRGVAPAMDPEIDAWLAALNLNLQEWHLLLREKQRIRK
ncbi:MAG TPA: HEAT repeat domain-containing protein [Archangium sp.]|uniref:HEAT repeat domain-containing protein n=1 Tax=Archangium sp. TaxID=1872627 RepID=UPI002EDB5DEF